MHRAELEQLHQKAVKVVEFAEYESYTRHGIREWDGHEDLNGKSLIIRHTWGLGDVLLSTPFLKYVREKYPQTRILYVTSHPELLRHDPAIDRLVEIRELYEGGLVAELASGNARKVDFDDFSTVNLRLENGAHGNEQVGRLERERKSCIVLSGKDQEFLGTFAKTAKLNNGTVQVESYFRRAGIDIGSVDDWYPAYYPLESEMKMASSFLKSIRKIYKKPILFIQSYSSSVYKDYPHWKEVIELLAGEFVFLATVSGASGKLYGFYASDVLYVTSIPLRDLAAMVMEADMVVGPPSIFFLIRAASKKDGLILTGTHDGEFYVKRWPEIRSLRISRLGNGECAVPCAVDYTPCPLAERGQYPPCMEELGPEVVADKIRAIRLSMGI